MEGYASKCQRICRVKMRGFVFLIGLMVSLLLAFQTFRLLYRYNLSPIFPNVKISIPQEMGFSGKIKTASMSAKKFSLLRDSLNFTYIPLEEADAPKVFNTRGIVDKDGRIREIDEYTRKADDSNDAIALDWGDDFNETVSKKVGGPIVNLFTIKRIGNKDDNDLKENIGGLGNSYTSVSDHFSKPEPVLVFEQLQTLDNKFASLSLTSTVISNDPSVTMDSITVSSGEGTKQIIASARQVKERLLKNETLLSLQSISIMQNNGTEDALIPLAKKKKQVMAPVYLPEMNKLFIRNHASHRSMRPRWSSALDTEILAAKAQIENASIVKNDRRLHAPLFRNLSMFRRSYELMEHTLKVYIYEEGGKPIFHQPLLGGIYASEGWFMKLMETNRQFVVKDPRRAHLFYMPFSSRYLQSALYVPNSHSRTNLEDHLKNYVGLIASKHPFWNRTGGTDHFLVACHDWAPSETRHTMERSIRALCSADLRVGFKLGKDISLPQTYVRFPRDPLKDLGGGPANRRHILAFFAGNMHGNLRPVLLQQWENKDPDMKIFGPLPPAAKRKMNYIQHMKSSKYCICPRGYEVNSPRLVESIFYECVPVIISDCYVPPFFEVLNWEAFSVIIPEKDVPRLKEILESIPEERYLALHMGVRRVQQHFLWHSKPVKYDLFHMVLHSIWFNRVYQIRTR